MPNLRTINYWPRRTEEEGWTLRERGWFPFPELTEEENDTIFRARLAGYGSCFPCIPTAEAQARNTLAGAFAYLEQRAKKELGLFDEAK